MPSWRSIFDFIAGLGSLLGLLFSYLAWQKAKLAVEAAREARKAVRKGNAREDLSDLSEKAKFLLQFTQQDQRGEALVTSASLLSSMRHASVRWAKFLGAEGPTRLKSGAKKVEKISVALSLGGAALTVDEREMVLEYCHDVVAMLGEESGKLMELIEGEDSDA